MNTDELIPMDEAIADFKLHLNAHSRTILSAKFGDGKSCFLDAAKDKLKDDYEFITIYPVNYQVEDNRDIFDLIKYDILFQLYSRGIASADDQIPNKIALPLYLRYGKKDLASELMTVVTSLRLPGISGAVLSAISSLSESVKRIRKKYGFWRKSKRVLEDYMKHVDNLSIYDGDPISEHIVDVIKEWHNRFPEKKMVLLIEDMDRMDPAHIFRILNIISAHIDYCYKYGARPGISLDNNKFGFDNLVISLDFDNLKRIYGHFYGSDTSFGGYISKFTNSGIFNYSLNDQKATFFKKRIASVCEINRKLVEAAISDDILSGQSLRDLACAVDSPEKQIDTSFEEGDWPVNLGLFKLAVIMRRLGVDDVTIKECFKPIGKKHPREFLSLFYSFGYRTKLEHSISSHAVSLELDGQIDYTKGYYIFDEPDKNGVVQISGNTYLYGKSPVVFSFNNCIESMISHVGQ